ncbi:MAG TPA: alpha/beta hydrolase-fold protein [Candidatus Acidoferrum sp.]|nr:alpha/beta hydrolase-fold protein [Candidatus Acidoferrum sp.]
MKKRMICSKAPILLMLALILVPLAFGGQLTKDDIEFRKKAYVDKKGERLPYRLYVPLGYDANRKYPLLLWLHGGDGRGSDNVRQLNGGNQIPAHFWAGEAVQLKFPMFVLLPQCPSGDNWSDPDLNQPTKWLEMTMRALADVEKEFSIDTERLYLAGQSMGGLGVWSTLQAYPGQWAAAVILSAYDNFTDLPVLAQTPLWVFQGDQDETVPVTLVRAMMKQLNKAHANLRYTEYRKTDHEVWKKAFAEPDLLLWLSAQKRGQPAGGQVGTGASPATH